MFTISRISNSNGNVCTFYIIFYSIIVGEGGEVNDIITFSLSDSLEISTAESAL